MKKFTKDSTTTILLALTALGIGLYFRFYPLLFYTHPDASEKATVLVIAQLKAAVAKRVTAQYPDIPAYQRNSMIKKSFDELLRLDGQNVRLTIERVAHQIEKETGPSQPYLLESDSFNYFNLTENILKTGRLSDTVRGSKFLNPLMLAPSGYYEPLNLHPYVGYGVYRAVRIFKPDISLMSAIAYTSCIIVIPVVLIFFFLCRNLGCHIWSILIGSVFFLLAPIFLKRSCYGWYDNDPYNALFPLLILFGLFKGFESSTVRRSIAWAIGTSLLTMAYALFWQGWVFLFCLLVGGGLAVIAVNLFYFRDGAESRRLSLFLATIVFGVFGAVALAFGVKDFFVLFEEGWQALEGFMNPSLSLWPDMYISVGELHKATWKELIELTGGWLFFLGSWLGIVSFLFEAHRKQSRTDLYKGLVLSLFFFLTVYLTLGAQRFALLCLIPMSLLFTLGVEFLLSHLQKNLLRFQAGAGPKIILQNYAAPLLCLLLIILPIVNAHKTTLSLVNRIFNDTWNSALTQVEEKTPSDSIVNTWWPPGHFIKAIAHRRVTFDGATINKPQAYWMANIFLETDERKAMGLLRMLNDSGNSAVEYLQSLGMDLSQVVELLKKITPVNRDTAATIIQKTQLNKESQDALLLKTHAAPPPSYLLIYNELVEKNLVLSFVNRWDFKKVEDLNRDPLRLKEVPRRKSKEYVKFLWDIAGGPLFYSEVLTLLTQRSSILVFEEGLQVDTKDHATRINSNKFGRGIPKNILYLDGENVVKKAQPNATLPYTVVLFKDADRFGAVLMDERLADSLLVRLYYFAGKGLKYFQPIIEEADLTKRTRILVYEAKWGEFLEDIGEN